MPFIEDYLKMNEKNECPLSYHIWSSFVVLSSAMGRRVYLDFGSGHLLPNLYVCLVGRQGLRKSTAKDIGRDLFSEALPDHPLGASIQSAQDIVKSMSSDDFARTYTDENGAIVECKPMTWFINELKNFLSINPCVMIDFLTDIYDRKFYDCSTIKHGLQAIYNPCVNVLACETPKWIISRLKMDIITGGFSRRMIYVYELNKRQKVVFPELDNEARAKCLTHLRAVGRLVGPVKWSPDAKQFFSDWYLSLVSPDDEIMEGYYESKHIQALKVAMCLCASDLDLRIISPVCALTLTREHIELAIAHLDAIETNMPKLSVAAGRNELALPQSRLLDLLDAKGGMCLEHKLVTETDKDATPLEQNSILRHLEETQRVVRRTIRLPGDLGEKRYIFSFARYEELLASGEIQPKK